MLGRYPEPWWTKTWTTRGEFFEDSADATGRVVELRRGSAPGKIDGAEVQNDEGLHAVVFERAEPRSLREAIQLGLVYDSSRVARGFSTGPSQARKLSCSLISSRIFSNTTRSSVSQPVVYWSMNGLNSKLNGG